MEIDRWPASVVGTNPDKEVNDGRPWYGFHVDFLGCYYRNSHRVGVVIFTKEKRHLKFGTFCSGHVETKIRKGEISKEEYEEKKKDLT